MIFTVHNDNGAANSQALLEVLERLKPEVAFLEVSAKGFEGYFSSPGLENRAIAMLIKRAHLKLVPIDNVLPTREDIHLYDKLFGFLDAQSEDVCLNKQREITELVRSNGFEYLNSDKYFKAQSELENREAKVVEVLGDSEIKGIYSKWRSVNSDREKGMVDSIFSYCEKVDSLNAVYLVGAAHRIGLEARILERFQTIPDVKWVIGYY